MELTWKKGVRTLAMVCGTCCLLVGVARAGELGTVDTSKESVAKIQHYIEGEKKGNAAVKEIAVYATGTDGNTTRIASTDSSAIGKPADPEDIDAIINNQVVTIPEGKALDVTVPLTNDKGQPAAVAGIKMETSDKLDKKAAQSAAEGIAKKIGGMLLNK